MFIKKLFKIKIMIQSVEQLKKERPDLVKKFTSMSKEELLLQCYLESIDAINMEKRVSVFMELCTIGLSKTSYTEESLRAMILKKKEYDRNLFCSILVEDSKDDDEIADYVRAKALEHDDL